MELFRTLVEQPIFNLLEVIYALVPGHDLGIAIIIFTAIVRLSLWPLVKKQLHHSRKMRLLQPQLKKIKKAAKGDRQKEARLQMEFYKEHEIKPFSTVGTLIVQIPIFIGLYQAVLRLIRDPNSLQTFSYSWVRDLPWIQHLASYPNDFNTYFLGLVDLTQRGLTAGGGIYFAAAVLAAFAALMQYLQSKNLLADQKDARKLSQILKDAASGKETDQAEMTAAVSKGMIFFMPIITFLFSMSLPSALSLYLLTSSGVGLLQQKIILREDVEEMEAIARTPSRKKSAAEKALVPDKEEDTEFLDKAAKSARESATTTAKAKPTQVKTSKSGGVDLKVTISSSNENSALSSKTKTKKSSSKGKKRRKR